MTRHAEYTSVKCACPWIGVYAQLATVRKPTNQSVIRSWVFTVAHLNSPTQNLYTLTTSNKLVSEPTRSMPSGRGFYQGVKMPWNRIWIRSNVSRAFISGVFCFILLRESNKIRLDYKSTKPNMPITTGGLIKVTHVHAPQPNVFDMVTDFYKISA